METPQTTVTRAGFGHAAYKPPPTYYEPNNRVLRDEGDVFWDSNRLHRLGRMNKPWEVEVAEWGFPAGYRDRPRKPSAERRLEGVVSNK